MTTTTPASDSADLRTAAQAVIDRWDTPLWKDVPATAEYIGRLRAALAAGQATAAPENIRGILARCRDFIDTTKAPAYPAGVDLADEIDALLAAQPAPPPSHAAQAVVPAGPWSLGHIDGNWRDIDRQGHGGVMRIVWRMEGQERTPKCEALAHAVIAALNGAAAPAQPAAQQVVAYAALPTSSYAGRVYEEGFLIGTFGTCPLYTADQLRAFADATHALRASHGQAPAQPDPAYSAACNLATALFKKHFAHLPDYASGQVVWGLFDSTEGVILQIDNMVAGLVQPPTTSPQADSVLEDAARLLESQHTWITNVAAANLVRSFAARKQGENHD